MRVLVLAITALFFNCAAIAAPATIKVIGPKVSCGAWVSERRLNSVKYREMEFWVMGFVSGWAEAWSDAQKLPTDPLRSIDKDGAVEWITRYCGAHPLDQLTDALIGLVIEIESRQKSN